MIQRMLRGDAVAKKEATPLYADALQRQMG
jgi:hypothetical protein